MLFGRNSKVTPAYSSDSGQTNPLEPSTPGTPDNDRRAPGSTHYLASSNIYGQVPDSPSKASPLRSSVLLRPSSWDEKTDYSGSQGRRSDGFAASDLVGRLQFEAQNQTRVNSPSIGGRSRGPRLMNSSAVAPDFSTAPSVFSVGQSIRVPSATYVEDGPDLPRGRFSPGTYPMVGQGADSVDHYATPFGIQYRAEAPVIRRSFEPSTIRDVPVHAPTPQRASLVLQDDTKSEDGDNWDDEDKNTLSGSLEDGRPGADYPDIAPAETQHFGSVPDKQTRRLRKEIKHSSAGGQQRSVSTGTVAAQRAIIPLTNGNLVLSLPVPTRLRGFLPFKDSEEFTHMRYTAATCDADDYLTSRYSLRQADWGRTTELFIVVTLYNEDEQLLTRTLHGVMKNIAHLCTRSRSKTWGKEGWKKVVVCIVADGRKKVHPRVLSTLAALGVYQEGVAKNIVDDKEVRAHIYEYTTQLSIDPELKFRGAEKGIVPTQILFCLKEKNEKKINSHRWFFNAFAPVLSPNVCILIDVGTRPEPKSLYHLWKAFDLNSNVAGACGEIQALKGKYGGGLLNPLVASQNFEYKMSNILDKPLESVFGYITVLPGAFSAYRYIALRNDELGRGPLASYFKGEHMHKDSVMPGSEPGIFTSNMYLAEDRILCFELVAKRNESWILKYVKSAVGTTDVPDTVPEFISQRRRWLNGSFFAAVYSLCHTAQILQTDHSRGRKIAFFVETAYVCLNMLFTWFGLANFYLLFYFIGSSLSDVTIDPFNGAGRDIFLCLQYFLSLLIIAQFVLAMGNRPQGSKQLYVFSFCAFAGIMVYMLFASIWLTYKSVSTSLTNGGTFFHDQQLASIYISLISTYGVYVVMSVAYATPWHLITSFAQYLLLTPAYIVILGTYAFANMHNVSWGTKGDNGVSNDLGAAVTAGKTAKGKDAVEIELPTTELDLNALYDNSLQELREPRRVDPASILGNPETIKEDYYKEVRTRTLLLWMATNYCLASVLSNVAFPNLWKEGGNNWYLTMILVLVAILAVFRAVGSSVYLIMWACNR